MSAYTQSIQLMVTASQANINEIKVAEVLKKMAGTTGLEPATSDVTDLRPGLVKSLTCLGHQQLEGVTARHGSP